MILPPNPNSKPKRKRTTNPKRKSKKTTSSSSSEIEQQEEDIISNLPDSILIHIISLLDIKEAYQTSILSKRWNNNLLNHLPAIRLNHRSCKTRDDFNNILSRVLSLRDDLTSLHTLKINHSHSIQPDILKTMVEYAVSHHVHRLTASFTFHIQQTLPCLTYLDLAVRVDMGRIVFPNSLDFPALTELSLSDFYFRSNHNGRAEPFSAFNKLNTLSIINCKVLNAADDDDAKQQHVLCISSSTLVNLTVLAYFNLDRKCKLELSSPRLCNFYSSGAMSLELCQTNICSVKHLYITACMAEEAPEILTWLNTLANIKSLHVNSSLLQVLSLIPDLFKVKFTSLCNLESLQVRMEILPSTTYDALKDSYMKRGLRFNVNQ